MIYRTFSIFILSFTVLSCNQFEVNISRTSQAIKVQSAVVGGNSACALLDDGQVSCWGSNTYGQLLTRQGWIGESQSQLGDNLTPINFGDGKYATSIGSTSWGSCAILNDQTVKCWGESNSSGQMGYGDTGIRTQPEILPVQLGTGKVPVKIVGGMYFYCALFSDSTVKCWGANEYGQLGLGDLLNRGDNANEMGDHLPTVDVGAGLTVKDIYAGSYHTCAILSNDLVKCWGRNQFGQLGLGDKLNRGDNASEMGDSLPYLDFGLGRSVKKLSLGAHQSCALLDNDLVKCWGRNQLGQLGTGDTLARGDDPNEMGDNLPYVDLGLNRTVKDIQSGFAFTCVILDDDSLKCWGSNSSGQLGLGHSNILGDGPNEMGDDLPTVDLGPGLHAVSLFSQSNSDAICAELNSAQYKCWGTNTNLQLANGSRDQLAVGDGPNEMGDSLLPLNLGSSKTASMISVFTNGMCALLSDQTIRCWGQNIGALGTPHLEIGNDKNETGTALPRLSLGTGLKLKQISTGNNPCALFTDGSLKCWGVGDFGGTGQGSKKAFGVELSHSGDGLPFVNLGSGRHVSKIFNHGSYHICALLDNQDLKCWGYNAFGQLGLGDINNRGDGANEMGDNLTPADLGTGRVAVDVSIGWMHTCAILDNGSVKCWGSNSYGQLGLGDVNNRGDGANEMGDNLPTVDLGTGRTAKAVSNGSYHSCALLDNNSVKCWGNNQNGQLGLGDTINRGDGANEMGDNLPAVDLGVGRSAISIVAGAGHTCALLDNIDVKCWGRNSFGQLGQENFVTIGDNSNEMGNNLAPINFGQSTVRSILSSANSNNTCALFNSGELKCWGQGNLGMLARGTSSSLGGGVNHMGDFLRAIDFGSHGRR